MSTTGNGLPPAGWYADTTAPGQERWWGGTAWGAQTRPQQGVVQTAPAQHHSGPSCRSCGSGDLKTLRAVRDQGTSTGTGSASSWVQGSGNEPGHMVHTSIRTTNYTDAASAAAPPSKRSNGLALIGIGVVVGAVLGFIGAMLGDQGTFGTTGSNVTIAAVLGIALVAIGLVLVPGDIAFNTGQYPGLLDRWRRSWACQRCGSVTVI